MANYDVSGNSEIVEEITETMPEEIQQENDVTISVSSGNAVVVDVPENIAEETTAYVTVDMSTVETLLQEQLAEEQRFHLVACILLGLLIGVCWFKGFWEAKL